MSPVAVLDGLALHALGRSSQPYDPASLASLADAHRLAGELGVRQLWLTPAAVVALGFPEVLPRGNWVHPFLNHGTLTVPQHQLLGPWLSVWGGEPDAFVEVVLPCWDRGSPWRAETYGPALLGELEEFASVTGTLWRRSGAITSDAWLRAHHGARLRPTDQPPPAEDANLEPDLCWARAPEGPAEDAARLCLAFDLNAMYLGAASSLALPVGGFVLTRPAPAGPLGPGYWQTPSGWVTTPTAAWQAERTGFEPVEGYTWPESHRYLEPWYRMLRDARSKLIARGPSTALDALKQVYRQGIGRLGSTRRSTLADPLYQPYWRHAVQAEARARLERRIATLSQAPVAVDVDCLYFLTSARNPERFAKTLGLPLGAAIGQFKFAGSLRGREAREALGAPFARTAIAALRASKTGA